MALFHARILCPQHQPQLESQASTSSSCLFRSACIRREGSTTAAGAPITPVVPDAAYRRVCGQSLGVTQNNDDPRGIDHLSVAALSGWPLLHPCTSPCQTTTTTCCLWTRQLVPRAGEVRHLKNASTATHGNVEPRVCRRVVVDGLNFNNNARSRGKLNRPQQTCSCRKTAAANVMRVS